RDGKTAFIFAVNVSGVLADATVRNQSMISMAWDEVWEARTAITDRGWSAELRIPLRILRFDANQPVQSWGLQATRSLAAVGEYIHWSLVPRSVSDFVSHFGRLDDLRDLKRGGSIELRPFVSVRAERQDVSADTAGRSFGLEKPTLQNSPVGLDLKWHVAQDLTLDAAALPDFGQVEADQLILNLTNYETFLPEKRPLFIEGSELLSTVQEDTPPTTADSLQNHVFYSRRIGNAPAKPTLAMGERLTEPPRPSTIYGAAKLTGQVGGDVSVAALSALTADSSATITQPNADARTLTVAPTTSFNVLRVRRELGSGHVGIIATGTSRFESTSPPGAVAATCPDGSAGAVGRCFHDAYVGGADGFWRFGGGGYSLGAQLLGTRIVGGPQRQLADGTMIGDGDAGFNGWVRLAKENGERFVWAVDYAGYSRRVDYNDAGFLARQNLHELKGAFEYRHLAPTEHTREIHLRLEASSRFSLDGLDLGKRVQLSQSVTFRNLWALQVAVGFLPGRFDDREIGEQNALAPGATAALERARALALHADMGTDYRRRFVLWAGGDLQLLAGARSANAWASVAAHPLPQLEFGLDPSFTYSSGEPRFAASEGTGADTGFVFGRLLAKSAGATLRANYTFTPQLTLQTYAQLFLASGHYTDLHAVARATGKFTLADIAAAPAPQLPPDSAAFDFEQAALNVNVVLRWEYRPGSTLYLVYARSQVPAVDMLTGAGDLRLSALRHGGAADVILFKLSYFWAG
ncbi:MAG TPA: DUF5916 domain-containing protein, partial [Polyangia bacterium]|nr:DUF5916 domain-containing protein [Polyangia bacterium]